MISYKPKSAKIIAGHKAWWYDNSGSIHVLIQDAPGTSAVSCLIKRSELIKYIKRSAK